MKEEHLKRLLAKAKIETSDEFLNTLMHRVNSEFITSSTTKILFSVKRLLVVCSLLIAIVSLITYIALKGNYHFFNVNIESSTTPIIVIVFGILLFVLNNLIRSFEVLLNRSNT